MGYPMPKLPCRRTTGILTHNLDDTFPKSISPKLNVGARLEFELAYFEAVVLHVTDTLLF